MLGVGAFFLRKNKNHEDYYVGGRSMNSFHVGLSVVATDVGGGFSIGLGGLGFAIGLSGSWLLFTGLLGAWISAVILVPKIYKLGKLKNLLTFPQVFKHFYGKEVAFAAGIISAIGYIGFTSSQLLAGAKLFSSTFESIHMDTALIIMGLIAVIYTVMGGLKAVIYTDTIQWIILMAGLFLIGIPVAYYSLGGYEAIVNSVPEPFLTLTNTNWQTIVKWMVTVIPIWFVGMTLYQRIFASKDEKSAKKAWFIAGLFEYPIMAFMGVILGLFARVAFENNMFAEFGFPVGSAIDHELGLPLLLRKVIPVGLMGLIMSAFFSAIMSTADSCLMAASGNIMTDIFPNKRKKELPLFISQLITLLIGIIAITLAWFMEDVLELMLYSYSFMVSGLFIPILGALFWKRSHPTGALIAMIMGGLTTVLLTIIKAPLPLQLDPNVFGITVSAVFFFSFSLMLKSKSV